MHLLLDAATFLVRFRNLDDIGPPYISCAQANCLAELGQQRKQEKFFELAIGDYRKSLQYVQNNDLRLKLSSALVALGKYTGD